MRHAAYNLEVRMSQPTPVRLKPHHGYRSWTTNWYDEQRHHRCKRFGREGQVTEREATSLFQSWLENEWRSKAHIRNPDDPAIRTVKMLADDYEEFARTHFVKDGRPTGHMSNVHYGMEALRAHHADLPLDCFDYPKLARLRNAMVKGQEGALSVKTVNGRLYCIKAAFEWARDRDWVSAVTWNDVKTVKPLKAGRSEARDSKTIRPVSDSVVSATCEYLPATVRAMVDVQLLSHMRPGEVCMMRPCDIDASGDVWVYTPESHKTQHKGKVRQVPLGPKAQDILRPFLSGRITTAYLFSPAQAQAERLAAKAEARKTPLSCGNAPGTNRKAHPKVSPGERYDCQSYRKAIRFACKAVRKAANDPTFPIWHPNQLRHTAGTKTRESQGYAAAVDLLGHSAPSTTAIYAEWSLARAKELARKVG